jgi:hypothetical protein
LIPHWCIKPEELGEHEMAATWFQQFCCGLTGGFVKDKLKGWRIEPKTPVVPVGVPPKKDDFRSTDDRFCNSNFSISSEF